MATRRTHKHEGRGLDAGADCRQIALEIVCRAEEGARADRLVQHHLARSDLGVPDANLVRELVRGVLTWRSSLDHTLGPYLRQPLADLDPLLRNLLRIGAYQIRFLDRVPAYAAVSQAVDLARRHMGKSMSGLVNAVLRGVSEDRRPAALPDAVAYPAAHLAAALSHPEWMVGRWLKRHEYGDVRRLCETNNAPLPLSIRANTTVMGPHALGSALEAEGVALRPSRRLEGFFTVTDVGPLFRSATFQSGACSVQGEGSGLAVELLAPRPGETILDVCSAPGGKTAAIAERMAGRGTVVAVDRYSARLGRVRENIGRLRLSGVRCLAADGRKIPFSGAFDRVLVDAPCTGTGILGRRPEIRWNRTPADLIDLARLQGELLANAAESVRPGGILLYSTCSLEPEENEAVAEAFLRSRSDFRLERADEHLDSELAGAFLQTWPHRHGCDGAFAARMRRLAPG